MGMHRYCVECLGMSAAEAYRKLQTARLMERYPTQIRGLLESGEANLTHLAIIEKVVTSANATQMFEEVRGKSTREVERMLRREDAKPDVSEAVEHVTTPRKESVELLAPNHWALRAMMDDATKALYDDILDLLAFEQRTPGEVLKLAFVELRERLMVKKRRKLRSAAKPKRRVTESPQTEESLTAKPSTELPPPAQPFPGQPQAEHRPTDIRALIHSELVGPRGATRYVPADIARLVFERDNNQCQFVGENGRRCSYCRCHNLYQGELDFGQLKRSG